MSRDDLIGFSLVPVILICCVYHNEMADVLGIFLNYLFELLG